MAWQGFRPVCRIRTPAVKALSGFIIACARDWGTNGHHVSLYLMKAFSGGQFLFGFSGHIIG